MKCRIISCIIELKITLTDGEDSYERDYFIERGMGFGLGGRISFAAAGIGDVRNERNESLHQSRRASANPQSPHECRLDR